MSRCTKLLCFSDESAGLTDGDKRSQRVTLKLIAELAGVHPATVSRALDPEKSAMISEETRLRVLQKAAELDYQPNIPARTLRHGRSSTMGVVVADLENPTPDAWFVGSKTRSRVGGS